MEFYKKAGYIFVEYNEKEILLENFLKLPESKRIVHKIYHKIFTNYLDEIEYEVENISHKGEVVGVFIKKYFMKKEHPYDVILLDNGNVVRFNLEKK